MMLPALPHPDFSEIKAMPFGSRISLRRHDGSIWRAPFRDALATVGEFPVQNAILNHGRWQPVMAYPDSPMDIYARARIAGRENP